MTRVTGRGASLSPVMRAAGSSHAAGKAVDNDQNNDLMGARREKILTPVMTGGG